MSPSRPPRPGRPGARPDPRAPEARADEPASVICPHCGSTDVELEAPFGSQLMTSQYWCRACRTVFERVKIDPDEAPSRWLQDDDDPPKK